MRPWIHWLCPLFLLHTLSYGMNLNPGIYQYTWQASPNSTKRHYVIITPKHQRRATPYPVVFFFHGAGGTPQSMFRPARKLVDEKKIVAILPAGKEKHWDMGLNVGADSDVAFIEGIIRSLPSRQVNRQKLYAIGASNGAGMVNKLLVQTRWFQGAGLISTTLVTDSLPRRTSATPNIIQIHGMRDRIVPYDGGYSPKTGYTFVSLKDTAALWGKHLNCQRQRIETKRWGDVWIRYDQCTQNRTLTFIGCKRCGHMIPPNFQGDLFGFLYKHMQST